MHAGIRHISHNFAYDLGHPRVGPDGSGIVQVEPFQVLRDRRPGMPSFRNEEGNDDDSAIDLGEYRIQLRVLVEKGWADRSVPLPLKLLDNRLRRPG
jgi:hypothetical protein